MKPKEIFNSNEVSSSKGKEVHNKKAETSSSKKKFEQQNFGESRDLSSENNLPSQEFTNLLAQQKILFQQMLTEQKNLNAMLLQAVNDKKQPQVDVQQRVGLNKLQYGFWESHFQNIQDQQIKLFQEYSNSFSGKENESPSLKLNEISESSSRGNVAAALQQIKQAAQSIVDCGW